MNTQPKGLQICAATVLTTLLSAAAIGARAQDQQPNPPANNPPEAEAPPTLQPPLAVTLSGNPAPYHVDVGGFGPVYVTSVLSGLAQVQSHVVPSDRTRHFDVDSAQFFINKPTGKLQFFLQAGYYSIPVLGVPYIRAIDATQAFFTPVSQGYVKFAANDNFSVMVGKLPTLIGAETTFAYQNMNIQRGLLWNQENAVNRGVQVNYSVGPLTFAGSVNDGFYSDRYSWVSLSASYAIDKFNTVTAVAAGNTNHTGVSTTRTPLFQNNQQIYNLIYTRTDGPWTIQPYLQTTYVPKLPQFGATDSASTYGGALLVSYDFGSDATPAAVRTPGFKLPVRLEYIGSSASAAKDASGAPNLLYGPGSKAWSVSITPTYQNERFFVRAELSYVGVSGATPGLAFGTNGNSHSQARALIELGVLL